MRSARRREVPPARITPNPLNPAMMNRSGTPGTGPTTGCRSGVEVQTPAHEDGRTDVVIGDWRNDGHAVRVAVLAQGVRLVSTSVGEIEDGAAVATGISLDQTQSETLVWGGH